MSTNPLTHTSIDVQCTQTLKAESSTSTYRGSSLSVQPAPKNLVSLPIASSLKDIILSEYIPNVTTSFNNWHKDAVVYLTPISQLRKLYKSLIERKKESKKQTYLKVYKEYSNILSFPQHSCALSSKLKKEPPSVTQIKNYDAICRDIVLHEKKMSIVQGALQEAIQYLKSYLVEHKTLEKLFVFAERLSKLKDACEKAEIDRIEKECRDCMEKMHEFFEEEEKEGLKGTTLDYLGWLASRIEIYVSDRDASLGSGDLEEIGGHLKEPLDILKNFEKELKPYSTS